MSEEAMKRAAITMKVRAFFGWLSACILINFTNGVEWICLFLKTLGKWAIRTVLSVMLLIIIAMTIYAGTMMYQHGYPEALNMVIGNISVAANS